LTPVGLPSLRRFNCSDRDTWEPSPDMPYEPAPEPAPEAAPGPALPSPLARTFAERLRAARVYRGWSPIELALRLETSVYDIVQAELAQCMPHVDGLVRIAQMLHVSTDYMLGLDVNPDPRDYPKAPSRR